MAVKRFNFRGGGKSGGTFSDGIGEQDDVSAALTFATSAPNIDSSRLGLAGYSFGGRMPVTVAAGEPEVKPFTPHPLRHFFATTSLWNGARLEVVSRLLGHASVAIASDIYCYVSREELHQMHGQFAPFA